MSAIPSFPEGSVESLAKLLEECGTGSDISRVLADRGICDGSGASTKWRRLYWIFLDIQRRDSCANRILDFIQSFLAPARFVGKNDEFEAHRSELNTVLALSGFEYRADGIYSEPVRRWRLFLKQSDGQIQSNLSFRDGVSIPRC